MSVGENDRAGLTRNQGLVLDALSRAEAPLSAYTILDQLREAGFRAPPQVYRALEKLVESGRVHRLESLNAFVACQHPGCDGHTAVAFTICEQCGRVAEVSDAGLIDRIRTIAAASGFRVSKSTVELRGLCADCASAAQGAAQ
ncbi:Fur family transcriptional regulator [Stappia sp. ES.058]|uniref:Fur family transcriptional regulator n=1 Tax=Stappia sp. ES.058 TaxID=1881061 RepID=UPI00087DB1ED|nr:Fur family transcriptional regulator [Stappia sp. ES.058]SDU03815.1 Fur family transcriptional regulator, zinc uptake regulator [Stappia sp. ES.058]